MSVAGKGGNIERELIHLFWERGLAAVRVAGSGRMNYPSPDILVNNKGKILAIECKSKRNEYIYLTKKEIKELRLFSDLFGAAAFIGARFSREKWYFLDIKSLKETKKNFVISVDLAKVKGLSFDELIKQQH